ncbi:MAG: hypothetical protein GY803_24160 [Chloroflexi bacterium]|nr:hypothetical protein [Chloroflexota bacterium]
MGPRSGGDRQMKETAVSQSHFNDICQLIRHKPPIEHDPGGKDFSFETQAVKPDGGKGFADVFYRDKFIWEYKGPHKDLDRAYRQLQLYRERLHNPPPAHHQRHPHHHRPYQLHRLPHRSTQNHVSRDFGRRRR